jgi:hypothetical protein
MQFNMAKDVVYLFKMARDCRALADHEEELR